MTGATDRLTPGQRQAVVRWKLGHHAFHLLLVAMNTRLPEAARAVTSGTWDVAATTLDDLTRLYDAATSTMRYAADFPRREYELLVRPSMMPPFAADGFSGVHNAEHAAMLAGLRELRQLYRQREADVPPSVERAWRQLRDAQRRNQRSHMYVCRRFVDDGASLLQEFFARRQGPGASPAAQKRPAQQRPVDEPVTRNEVL